MRYRVTIEIETPSGTSRRTFLHGRDHRGAAAEPQRPLSNQPKGVMAVAKGKDKPTKQTKKPKSDKPKGSDSSYQQEKASGRKG